MSKSGVADIKNESDSGRCSGLFPAERRAWKVFSDDMATLVNPEISGLACTLKSNADGANKLDESLFPERFRQVIFFFYKFDLVDLTISTFFPITVLLGSFYSIFRTLASLLLNS